MAASVKSGNDPFYEGDLLFWRCEYDKARKHFQDISNEPSISPENLARCYNSLGAANAKLQNYDEAVMNYSKQLGVLMNSETSNRTENEIVKCYMSIGMVYWLQHEYNRALKCHKQALEALTKPEASPDLTSNIYKNLANLHTKMKAFDIALQYFRMALEIDRYHLRENHPQFGQTYADIGAMYHSRQDYKEALKYYAKARDTWLKSLPPSSMCIEYKEKTVREILQKLGK